MSRSFNILVVLASVIFCREANSQSYPCSINPFQPGCTISNSDILSIPQMLPTGTAAAPSVAFKTSPTTGFFLTSAGNIGVAINGVQVGTLTSSGYVVGSTP